MSNFLTITQTSQTGYINNIHTAGVGGLNIQDNSSNILTISPLGDVSCNSLNTTTNVTCNSLNTTSLYIGNSTIFRFTPWTAIYGNNRPNNSTLPAVSYDGNGGYFTLIPAAGANWSYSYSIIGNTMYVNYQYYSSSSSTVAGNGIYFYTMPNVGFVIDTATLYSNGYYGQNNQDHGSQVGTCSLIHYGNANTQGPVRVSTINSVTYLYLMSYQSYGNQNSGNYPYTNSELNVAFVASFPIKLG